MATAIYVAGPTQIKIGADVLGNSDNDNLPTITFTDHVHEVKTVLSGMNPEEIVTVGTQAKIAVALVKWDPVVLNTLLAKTRAVANESRVGRRLIASAAGTFTLTIESVGAGGSRYEFADCYLQQDSVSDSQWGNRERVLMLNFLALPDPSTNVLYTYTPVTS